MVVTQLKTMKPASKTGKYLSYAIAGAIFLVGPALGILTFFQLNHIQGGDTAPYFSQLLWIDIIFLVVLAFIMAWRLMRSIATLRNSQAGSRLHMRLILFISAIALVPIVLAAVFAILTINVGLEGWFSDRVSGALDASQTAARAYENQQKRALLEDSNALAQRLNMMKNATDFMGPRNVREELEKGQNQIQRGLKEAYLIDGTGVIQSRGAGSYLFDFEKPTAAEIYEAQDQGVKFIEDLSNNEFRVIQHLSAFVDLYLYVSRNVDGKILALLDKTQKNIAFYQALKKNSGRILFEFGFLYIGVAFNLILGVAWVGLQFSERLSARVGQLTFAARRVGEGDFDIRIPESPDIDEITTLGTIFNRMTTQLKDQRFGLLEVNRITDDQRRLFDSVLSNISAGVIGLDSHSKIIFVNQAAKNLLRIKEEAALGHMFSKIVPEFSALVESLKKTPTIISEEKIRITRRGRIEDLLVRTRARMDENGVVNGYVIALDDVTDLVSAQRVAAWGDVARRIAHEVRNPLTPVRLSAERIQRKYASKLGAEGEALVKMTDVIIRQTNDISHIVSEFSKFSQMPEPVRMAGDLLVVLRDALALQSAALPALLIEEDFPKGPVVLSFDQTLLSQGLNNILKNACEAMVVRQEREGIFTPKLCVGVHQSAKAVTIAIADNGIGFPADRSRLFEPYVTTRNKGTGLGLAIIRKIVEEHGGSIVLKDAPLFADSKKPGALVEIELPFAEDERL